MLNFYRLQQDYLKFEGSDRLDLINRLSTNEVKSLEKYGGIKTILTSDKGRFVDILTLYNFGDFVFASCSFNNSQNVLAYLDKYTIMDDFKASDLSHTHETLLFWGDEANRFTGELFDIDTGNLNGNDFRIYKEDERHSIIAANDDKFGGFNFIFSSKDSAYWHEKIGKISGRFGLTEITAEEYEVKRIEFGSPAFGKEMTELTNPLECGLDKYVSFTKGCYIGQEVIARLDAYDKISKHLVGISSENSIPLGSQPGDVKMQIEGKECGFITSSCSSEKFGNIGLGFVKTIFLNYDKPYNILHNGDSNECKVVRLPFNLQTPQ